MEKIKDFFYEKSDIFFATLVVLVVVVVIMRNLGGWMNVEAEDSKYNEVQPAIVEDTPDENQDGEGEADVPADENADETDADAPDAEKTPDEETPAKEEPAKETPAAPPVEAPKPVETTTEKPQLATGSGSGTSTGQSRSIEVAAGSTAKSIAEALKAQGLISDDGAFLQSLASSGKDTKLKAGDFTIPEGSTVDQIIDILTK